MKSLVDNFVTLARNFRSKALFNALEKYCKGDVLDVGGWDFYSTIKNNSKINFHSWTNLETGEERLLRIAGDSKYKNVIGDGENMNFPDESFDTVINIQVLEHTFDPMKMVKEIGRVLKKGGCGIFLIPQTSVMHHPPRHYYNFTKFWVREAMKKAGLEIVELKPLGGVWTTAASHFVHFFFQSFKSPSYSTAEEKRNLFFYIFCPFMVIYAIISIPLCLVFGLGELTEEPNNWLVAVKKQ